MCTDKNSHGIEIYYVWNVITLMGCSALRKLLTSAWLGGANSVYSLTASFGSFWILLQSMDGPSSCKNLPNKSENLFMSLRSSVVLSAGAVCRSLSNSLSNNWRASRLVTSWNSFESDGTRWCPRTWKIDALLWLILFTNCNLDHDLHQCRWSTENIPIINFNDKAGK